MAMQQVKVVFDVNLKETLTSGEIPCITWVKLDDKRWEGQIAIPFKRVSRINDDCEELVRGI